MTDAQSQAGLIGAFPLSDLGRRLLRRATAPIGVIDVRHAAALHSRASLWPSQRLDLLENLKLRYGLQQGPGGAAHLVARAASAAPFAASLSVTANVAARPATAAKAASERSPEAPAERYRVKRPQAALNRPKPLIPQSVGASSATAGDGTGGEPVSGVLLQRKADAAQSPAGAGAESFASPPLRTAAAGAESLASPSLRTATSGASPYEEPISRQQAPRMALAVAFALQGPARTQLEQVGGSWRDDFGPKSARQDTETAPTKAVPPSAELTLSRKADHPPVPPAAADESERFAPRHDVGAVSGRKQSSIDEASTLRPPPSVRLDLRRKADPALAAAPENSVQVARISTARNLADTNEQTRGAVSAEMRVTPPPVASLGTVWRRPHRDSLSGESVPPILAIGSTPATGPRITPEIRSEPAFGVGPAPPSVPITDGGGRDLTHVARQVSRVIARELRVERERRGRTR